MDLLHLLTNIVLHLNPQHVNELVAFVGPWLYVVFFAIVFMETGLVVTPFLPGDSLLFTLGAVAASPNSPINLILLIVLLCLAANIGDVLNYTIGYRIGPKVFGSESSRLLNKKHLLEAQRFYEKHGRKTIILARFVPIIRTFAPFVAGVGKMPFSRFIGFSIGGGMLWVLVVTLAGVFFGGQPWVQKHFEVVVIAIVVISVIPVAIHALQQRKANTAGGKE